MRYKSCIESFWHQTMWTIIRESGNISRILLIYLRKLFNCRMNPLPFLLGMSLVKKSLIQTIRGHNDILALNNYYSICYYKLSTYLFKYLLERLHICYSYIFSLWKYQVPYFIQVNNDLHRHIQHFHEKFSIAYVARKASK